MSGSKIRTLLADDHLVVRMGLAAIIGLEKDIQVVGEVQNGEEAVEAAVRLNPDVVVMDLMMPRMGGVEATAEIRRRAPGVRILVLTTFGTSEDVQAALAAGASGAMVKDASHSALIDGIRATAAGRRIVSPEIERNMEARAALQPRLSPRHVEILGYVAKGLNNREIARVLGIGPDCVKAHLKTAFIRLDASSRSEAVALAIQRGLISV